MRNVDQETLALKVAEALLLYKGELSFEEIGAIPFIKEQKDVLLIANYLKSRFKTRIKTVRNNDAGFVNWEEKIILIK